MPRDLDLALRIRADARAAANSCAVFPVTSTA